MISRIVTWRCNDFAQTTSNDVLMAGVSMVAEFDSWFEFWGAEEDIVM